MNLLTNPVLARMVMGAVFALAAFAVAVLLLRALRQRLLATSEAPQRTDAGSFPVAAYSAVIQRLKEKEEELERLRRQASTRASATENISAAVLSNLPSGVVLFTQAGLVQQANRAAREILGYASMSGLAARDLFRSAGGMQRHPGLEARVSDPEVVAAASLAEAVTLSLQRGLTFRRIEATYSTPAGESRVLGVTISPVLGSAGEKLGAACLISDLTEIADLGRQVRLRESMAALGEMSAGIAHEFKNSLATISGYSQMLATESDANAVHDFARKISSETQVLSQIVTDFLNFARPEALQGEPLELPALIRRVAAEHQIELEMEATDFPERVHGDPTALGRAFSNLFRNSCQAANGKPLRVEIGARADNGTVQITYRDNAGGIPTDVLPKVFIPFFTTKPDGTGLGLALVHRILTQHGGAVTASNHGSGAMFTLSLPLRNGRTQATTSTLD